MSERKDPKEIFPNCKDRIEFAFALDGKDYYQFADINSIPCDRGFHALAFFEELNQRCTRDYLIGHATAVDNMINDLKSIKITELSRLNMILKERLEFLFEPEIAYKICSVVFFDASENPYRFEYNHALQKAALFRRVKLEDFFLSQPIVKLIPYTVSLSSDLGQYCRMVNLITKEHIKTISSMLSEADKRKEWYKSLELLLSEDSDLTKSKTFLSMSTTSSSNQ